MKILAGLWTALILVVLLVPLPRMPGPAGEMDWLAHLGLFAVETGLLWAAGSRTARGLAVAAAGAFTLALVTELLQHFLPYRTLQLSDLAADLGGIVATSLLLLPGYYFHRWGWKR